jgi:myo-inositol catabolism protein IolC
MARLLFEIWATRKNMTAEKIVALGVDNKEKLEEFAKTRGLSMPADITEFQNLWLVKEAPAKNVQSKEAVVEDIKEEKQEQKKPAPRKRSTRRKTNIKDTPAKAKE